MDVITSFFNVLYKSGHIPRGGIFPKKATTKSCADQRTISLLLYWKMIRGCIYNKCEIYFSTHLEPVMDSALEKLCFGWTYLFKLTIFSWIALITRKIEVFDSKQSSRDSTEIHSMAVFLAWEWWPICNGQKSMKLTLSTSDTNRKVATKV